MPKFLKIFLGLFIFTGLIVGAWLALVVFNLPQMAQAEIVRVKLQKYRACSTSSECEYISFNGGCYSTATNKKYSSEVDELTKNLKPSLICDYFFLQNSAECQKSTCVPKSVHIDPTTSSN